jgi:hypothetical protein
MNALKINLTIENSMNPAEHFDAAKDYLYDKDLLPNFLLLTKALYRVYLILI